eukprot:4600638-Heterocapsa_arctica.AAC.1
MAEDYQNHVDVKVYESERGMVKDNNYFGKVTLRNIPKTPRGTPKIKVTVNIDSNGILELIAEDIKMYNKGEILIMNEKGRLTQLQIEKKLRETDEWLEKVAAKAGKEDFEGWQKKRKSVVDVIKLQTKRSCWTSMARRLLRLSQHLELAALVND